jgi:Na+-driven multidrug efflux pump
MEEQPSKSRLASWIEDRHQDIFSFRNLWAFWGPTLSLIAYQLAIGLPFVICGVMIGILGDSFSLGVFGLASTFINMLFNSILNGLTENLGVHCSQLYSAKKYEKMGSYFWKGLVSVVGLTAGFVVSTFYSYEMLTAIDVQDNVAYATSILLKVSIPYLFLQAINNLLVCYLASQSLTDSLIYINTVSIVVVFFSAKLFILDWKMKEIGFAYTKLIQELVNLACYAFVLIKMADRNTLIRPSVSLITKGFLTYIKGLFMTVLSFYGEFIGFEVNTYFAALLHDISELALWCTLVNFSGIIFFISVGFSNAFRTFLGSMIGQRKFLKARTLSQHYLVYLGLFSMLATVLLLVFKNQIGYIYTGDVLLARRMADILVVYCINVFPTLAFYSIASIYRLLKQDNFLFQMATIVYPIMVISSSFVFCFPLHLKVYGINLGFSLSKLAITMYMIYYLYRKIDWKAVQVQDSMQQLPNH